MKRPRPEHPLSKGEHNRPRVELLQQPCRGGCAPFAESTPGATRRKSGTPLERPGRGKGAGQRTPACTAFLRTPPYPRRCGMSP